ncbi:MAG: hypothetical protein M5U28_38425 [Sandaracinaceae bacterium]|nr:hypothetical protein [Sandaracinaceae bacterium]
MRRVLLGPEQERLVRLESRSPADEHAVADVLPEAVARATQERPDALSVSLEPTTKRTLRAVIEREPEMIGEILAPSIGAAVRRALADALLAMQQRFDQALEQSLSIETCAGASRLGAPAAPSPRS